MAGVWAVWSTKSAGRASVDAMIAVEVYLADLSIWRVRVTMQRKAGVCGGEEKRKKKKKRRVA